jgi:hypothetical protein
MVNPLDKVFEDTDIKLASVATDVPGARGTTRAVASPAPGRAARLSPPATARGYRPTIETVA